MSDVNSPPSPNPLPIDAGKQPNDNWCWAYVAAAISRYHDGDQTPWTACNLANAAFGGHGQIDCARHVNSKICDRTYHLKDAFRNFTRNLREPPVGPVDAETIRHEILVKRAPVCVRVLWPGGRDHGHVFIIRGIGVDSRGHDIVMITDPIFGESRWRLADLRYKYQSGNGYWDETYFTQPSS